MPQKAAGPRIEPPVSEPSAAGTKPGRDRRPRAARRAAGEVLAVPRVARRRPRQVERWPAMREFMGRELAGQDRAGVVELAHRRRVGGGDGIDAGLGVAGGADAGGRIDVLKPERDAVHRPAIAAGHDLALGGAGLVERALEGRQQIGVELRIERFGPADQRRRQLDRRKLLLLDPPRRLGDGHESQVRSMAMSCRRARSELLGKRAGRAAGSGRTFRRAGLPTAGRPRRGAR